jgi:hypothetical protein
MRVYNKLCEISCGYVVHRLPRTANGRVKRSLSRESHGLTPIRTSVFALRAELFNSVFCLLIVLFYQFQPNRPVCLRRSFHKIARGSCKGTIGNAAVDRVVTPENEAPALGTLASFEVNRLTYQLETANLGESTNVKASIGGSNNW